MLLRKMTTKDESFAFGKDCIIYGEYIPYYTGTSHMSQMIDPKSVELHLELMSENFFEKMIRKLERLVHAVSKTLRSKFRTKEREDEGALEENI